MTVPAVLFLCVHNAGRSQMALGWFEHLAQGRAVAFSGGSEPATAVNLIRDQIENRIRELLARLTDPGP